MPPPDRSSESRHAGGRSFGTTHWSLVLAAAHGSWPKGRAALATLCQAYWHPLYFYIRRRGYQPDEAQDLTQAFFAAILEKGRLQAADPERGRFRSFLLGSLNHFLANEWDRARAKKRGGRKTLSLDIEGAEGRYLLEPADDLTAEKLFERRWAMTLLDLVLDQLQQDLARDGRGHLFEQLKGFLGGPAADAPYSRVAADLGMTESAVKMAVHRLRRRYRHLLRARIAQTVGSAEQIDDEIRRLFAALDAG
jgi:RNA polymerase sigma factor (sigma-70 family)